MGICGADGAVSVRNGGDLEDRVAETAKYPKDEVVDMKKCILKKEYSATCLFAVVSAAVLGWRVSDVWQLCDSSCKLGDRLDRACLVNLRHCIGMHFEIICCK